jgi:hypothetical protein
MSRIRRIIKTARGWEPAQSENDVLGAIRSLLEANGARVHRIVERIPWGKTTSTPGVPDLYGYWPKKAILGEGKKVVYAMIHFWIEVKKPGGKLRPAQVAWITQAQADGVICFMADSVEMMVEQFKSYGIEIKGL